MALTDTFVRQVKHKGAEIGERYADGGGMYLRVKAAGKYWRLDYRIDGKPKTMGLGVYPDVSLLQARERRDAARKLLATGTDPSAAKREEKKARADAAANTFEAVAREWLTKTAAKRAEGTQLKVKTWLEKDVLPFIGKMPMSTIGPRDILERVVRKLEARGAIDTAHRVKQHRRCKDEDEGRSHRSFGYAGDRNPARSPPHHRPRTLCLPQHSNG